MLSRENIRIWIQHEKHTCLEAHLENEAITFMRQTGDEGIQQLADLSERPEVFPPHAEQLCPIIVLNVPAISPLTPALFCNLGSFQVSRALNVLME